MLGVVQKRTRLERVLILPACEPGHSAMRALASGGLRTRVARQYLASKGGLTDTCIRTVSLRTGVSVSGKRNFVRRDKGDETSREVHREPRYLCRRDSTRHARTQFGDTGGPAHRILHLASILATSFAKARTSSGTGLTSRLGSKVLPIAAESASRAKCWIRSRASSMYPFVNSADRISRTSPSRWRLTRSNSMPRHRQGRGSSPTRGSSKRYAIARRPTASGWPTRRSATDHRC